MSRHFPKRSSEEKSIEATAAAWLAQQDDQLSPEQAAAFTRWRQENPLHEAAVRRLEKTWSTLHLLRDFRPESSTRPNRDLLATRRPTPFVPVFVLATITAIAASVVLVALWRPTTTNTVRPLATSVSQESDALIYTTSVDGYQRISLSDGTVVELNANTEIRVNYTTAERRVHLLVGEANFVVAKNPQRPFWVEAGTISVRAVGTVFNVRLASKDIEVLVTEGKVAVSANREREVALVDDGGPSSSITSLPSDDAFLTAGQRLVFSDQTPVPTIHIQSLPPDMIRDALAWQRSTLRFMDTPLAEVAAQFNRWNHVQIEIADPNITSSPVDGNFRANNVEGFVRLLESDGNVTVERVGTDRIILHKSR